MTERGAHQRAWLYIVIAILSAVIDKPKLNDIHVWLGAALAAFVAYRAYIDTSPADAKENA